MNILLSISDHQRFKIEDSKQINCVSSQSISWMDRIYGRARLSFCLDIILNTLKNSKLDQFSQSDLLIAKNRIKKINSEYQSRHSFIYKWFFGKQVDRLSQEIISHLEEQNPAFKVLNGFATNASLTNAQKGILPKVNRFTDQFYAGAYPAGKNDSTTLKMQKILTEELGITDYICLMDNDQIQELNFNPYIDKVDPSLKVKITSFEIPDGGVAEDDEVLAFIDQLIELAKDKTKKIYIHCWGGNGRTSTISTILLAKMYNITWDIALTHVLNCYRTRKICVRAWLPESEAQFDQIKRLCGGPEKSYKAWIEQVKA
jgi:protein-tyrosine phosphatase